MNLQTPVRVETLSDAGRWWYLEVGRRLARRRMMLGLWARRGKDSEALATIRAEQELCRRDPKYWIDHYGWVKSPQALDLDLDAGSGIAAGGNPYLSTTPLVLWPRQRELIDWFLERLRLGRAGLIAKSRELGVSWIVCHLVYGLCRSTRGFAAHLLSRAERLVDDTTERDRKRAAGLGGGGSSTDSLFGKLDYIHRCQPPWLAPRLELPRHPMSLRFLETDALITGESTNRGAGRGSRKSVVVIDEMAAMEPNDQESIWRSLASVAGFRLPLSTPGVPWCKFERLRASLPPGAIFEMDWDSDPRRDEDWKAAQIADLGGLDDFLTEFGMVPIVPSAGRVWSKVTANSVTYSDDDLFSAVPNARQRLQVFGAWDFGSGPSLLVCFFFLLDLTDGRPKLWLDRELTWDQTAWQTVSRDVVDTLRAHYSRYGVHFGDPAGVARESDQGSWEVNLRSGGVPLECLPASDNTRDQIEWRIRRQGSMMQEGSFRVHARCQYALQCIERWSRHLADGKTVEGTSALYIPPRHDKWSHGGMAMGYGLAGILRAAQMILAEGADDPREPAGGAFDSWHSSSPAYLGEGGYALDRILDAI